MTASGGSIASLDQLAHALVEVLESEASTFRREWWATPAAEVIVVAAGAAGLVQSLSALLLALRQGASAEWLVGGRTVGEAIAAAREWVDAGIDVDEIGPWLRTGCWNPHAARQMEEVGIRPGHLLDAAGMPTVSVDIGPEREVPIGSAVADNDLDTHQAANYLAQRSAGRSPGGGR